MPQIPPKIGTPCAEIDTPALVVDLDAYERNLDRLAGQLAGQTVRMRPHAKTHKCPTIAHHQIARGAVGVCCQTLGEAEVMVEAGVENVLITNQVVTPGKIDRLVELVRRADVMVCVDDLENVRNLDRVASASGVQIGVLVEVDIGQHRCGVDPGWPTLALAQAVVSSPGLRFAGLQAYHGIAQHVYQQPERAAVMANAIALVRTTVDLLRANGLECPIVSGAGTGTYPFELGSGLYNELQAGSYIFMDADYQRVGGIEPRYENALFVLSTVINRRPDRAVCDAGLKASSTDSGLPLVHGRTDVHYAGASDEHGTLQVHENSPLQVGDQLWLIPGHCDPTVNLHDWFTCIRNGRVEQTWPILARGRS